VLLPLRGIDAGGSAGASWVFEMAEAAAGRSCAGDFATAFLQTAFGAVLVILKVCRMHWTLDTSLCMALWACYHAALDDIPQDGGMPEHSMAPDDSGTSAKQPAPVRRRAYEVMKRSLATARSGWMHHTPCRSSLAAAASRAHCHHEAQLLVSCSF
jgi:hypothetical protein